ncbi:hypothetical protein CCACVL1_28125 [Corchorus capsularis]|uniref:Uncharacterized protein n=1 Tax=Corchorus capsularis TaxID=210143 RepID=A0A1R3G7K0_COCAP|nr:hypothetical protein CCACVL1_28125 [Corchorus capsularis]
MRKKRKWRYFSSDSYSSDSDSDYDSDSYSFDSNVYAYESSFSSDGRRHKRRRSSKRNKHQRVKKWKDGGKEKKRGWQGKRLKRKSIWFSSDIESESTSPISDSDDEKAGNRHVPTRTNRISKHAENESPQNLGIFFRHRSESPTPKWRPNNSRKGSPRSPPRKFDMQNKGRASHSPLGSPAKKASASIQGHVSSRSPFPGGTSKRVRKGRGFTFRYSSARHYRTPSPPRSYRYGERNFPERNPDR